MPFRPDLVVALLAKEFGCSQQPVEMTRAERKLAESFRRLLIDGVTDDLVIEEEELLEISSDIVDDSNWTHNDDGPYTPGETDKVVFSGINHVKMETVEKALKFFTGSKTKRFRTLSSMSTKFTFIKTNHDIQKLRRFASDGIETSRSSKFAKLSDLLREVIFDTIENKVPLHGDDIRRYAIEINETTTKISDFRASDTFIDNWKKRNGIVSRRISKFTSKKTMQDRTKTDEKAKQFVSDMRDVIDVVSPDMVWNADQSGFYKEQYCPRTLAPKGTKVVEVMVQSVNNLTHPYTVLPIVRLDGVVSPKLYVVLKEPNGFPQKGYLQTDNLIVRCNTSHIMTKELMEDWVGSGMFMPGMPTEAHVLLDSWTPWRNEANVQKAVPPGMKVHVHTIPAGATGKIQPLDLFFFGPMKGFMKKVHNHISAKKIPFVIGQRDNILLLLSAVYYIFSAPRFVPCWQYPWFKGGYVDVRPAQFETPVQFCLTSIRGLCTKPLCRSVAYIRCPYCSLTFCFSDWIGIGCEQHRC